MNDLSQADFSFVCITHYGYSNYVCVYLEDRNILKFNHLTNILRGNERAALTKSKASQTYMYVVTIK